MSKRKLKSEWQLESDKIHNYEFEILDNKTKITNMNNEEIKNGAKVLLADSFFRPKTMKELFEALNKGIKCEVVASVMEITNIKLNGWLRFEGKYQTYLSENIGWVIYEAF